MGGCLPLAVAVVKCTCSVFANEPSRSCKKHQKIGFTPMDRVMMYKVTFDYIMETYPPPGMPKFDIECKP